MTKKHPRTFETANGSTILVGRYDTQNDELTTTAAAHTTKSAFWFHVAGDVPGSHVVLYPFNNAHKPTKPDIMEAARKALFYSQAPDKYNGCVEYCKASNVRKLPDSDPGSVVTTNTKHVWLK